MIIAIGVDIVGLDRIAALYRRHGERFMRHVLTPAERMAALALTDPVPRLAGRFAAKEAVMKALGTGWGAGVNFTSIEVVNDAGGAPIVSLTGAAAERCRMLGGTRWHLSISHCRDYAVAQVVLEG